ncbi:MAG: polyhydroxybutyrate depolymerase [Alphaproteobacteria bacterium HGW-Alphaproteobacteria-6]|nr:MAG: polyhydroxybutyrate depolymerase [Alphaproteobacteria bacterium HGW-Alphaproteobacteria-6]
MRLISSLLGLALGLTAGLAATGADAGCGAVPEACQTAMGSYHVTLPPDPAPGPVPMLVFLHGAGGSGTATLKNRGMVGAFLARGYAVIAPDGLVREGRRGAGWYFHPGFPRRRDEAAFLRGVADDAAVRFGLDRDRALLAGFSIGGSMASYIACEDPAAFTAYAPVAGGFWRPQPESCTGPVRLLHSHGWRDTTVPLEGRPLRNGQIFQGDVFHSMEIWRDTNGCTLMRPDSFAGDDLFMRRKWSKCTKGSALEFALHPGGHMVPEGWATMVIDWFEGQPQG